ncbi:MAG: LysE family translocator, partial [Proteobacteria bacterium]|nr:LysE family translocator [Pseudomonadota bacterium]MBU1585980.1 LysE family translocator [Pseudomonadota bacterium]
MPLIIGIDVTYIVFTLLIGFGIGELFDAYPWLYLALKYAGSFYLLYLSYKIW